MERTTSSELNTDHNGNDSISSLGIETEDERVPVHVPDGFAVEDESSANWVVRKIIEARQYAERVEAWAAMEVRQAKRDEAFLMERYGSQLERWAAAELRKPKRRGRSRTVVLPAGRLSFRTEPPGLSVDDEKRLAMWCVKCLPEALKVDVVAHGAVAVGLIDFVRVQFKEARVEQHVLRDVVRRYVAETGEIPDGTSVISNGVRFSVR